MNELTEDDIIAMWADTMYRRTHSMNTLRCYGNILRKFQAMLSEAGKYLDPFKNAIHISRVQAIEEIEQAAQGFCSISSDTHILVATSTYNQRLSILSSFYEYAIKHNYFSCDNPLHFLERGVVLGTLHADRLEIPDVQAKMQRINRMSRAGKRDYALLSVLLTTGRRVSEVRRLTWADVNLINDRVVLTFHCKGGKIRCDALALCVGLALMDCIQATYPYGQIQPHAPLFVSKGPYAPTRSTGLYPPLLPNSIADVCRRRLGVTSVCSMHHTYAYALESIGANISERQRQPGHENNITDLYTAAMEAAKVTYADQLAALFGIE